VPPEIALVAALLGGRVQQQLLVPAIRYGSLTPIAQLVEERRRCEAPRFACGWTPSFAKARRKLISVLRGAAGNQYVGLTVYPSLRSFELGAGQKAVEMKARRNWRRLWTILVSDPRDEAELNAIPKLVRPLVRPFEEWLSSFSVLSREV
jgi:hypothetical protein